MLVGASAQSTQGRRWKGPVEECRSGRLGRSSSISYQLPASRVEGVLWPTVTLASLALSGAWIFVGRIVTLTLSESSESREPRMATGPSSRS